jgi:ribosomal protein L11 methyltransferase
MTAADSKTKYWIEIRVEYQQAPEDWAPYLALFQTFGISNTTQFDNPPAIIGYLYESPSTEDLIKQIEIEFLEKGATQVLLNRVPEEDWSNAWREFFKPKRIGKHWLIQPSWEPAQPLPTDRVITLDPGQAFGTGEHATTAMCLQLLETIDLTDKLIADIGCGSGILSVASCLAGAKEVCAVDSDEVAVDVALQNAEMNQVDYQTLLGAGFDVLSSERTFDLVISNIISAVLIQLSPEVYQRVKPGGHWIMSGIIEQHWPDVKSAAEEVGFKFIEMRQEGEWVAAIFSR